MARGRERPLAVIVVVGLVCAGVRPGRRKLEIHEQERLSWLSRRVPGRRRNRDYD